MINFLAIIPARKGSKGIINKNRTIIKKKKLIEYSFACASKAKLLDKIYLTTNDKQIMKLLPKYKKIKLIKRSNRLSSSKSIVRDAIIDAAKKIEKRENASINNIVILQPTSPQRTWKDVDLAIKHFKKTKCSNLISISEPINHPNELLYYKKKTYKKIIPYKKGIVNRQSYKKFYFINGSIFISNLKYYLNNKRVNTKKTYFFKMEKKHSIDLDDNFDKKIVTNFL